MAHAFLALAIGAASSVGTALACTDEEDCSLDGVARRAAGGGAIDCGSYDARFDDEGEPIDDPAAAAVAACVLEEFEAGRPFFAVVRYEGIDSEVAEAVAGTRGGEVTLISYDSDPCGGGGCGPYFEAAPCVGPHVVEEGGERYLTCNDVGPSRQLPCGDTGTSLRQHGSEPGDDGDGYEEPQIPCDRPPAALCVPHEAPVPAASEDHGSRWEPVLAGGAPAPRGFGAVGWTGTELVVWGGGYLGSERDSGGVLELASRSWRPITGLGAPARRSSPSTVWTGTELFLWGGRDAERETLDGFLYDPARDRWRQVSADGAPRSATDQAVVWTGSEVIVFGGYTMENGITSGEGRAYDPAADRWRRLPTAGAPSPRSGPVAVWTGTEVLVWGGALDGCALGDGAAYDPEADHWRPIAAAGAPLARAGAAHVWTGRELVVFGGAGYLRSEGCLAVGGGAYDPALDLWRTLPTDGDPGPRRHAIWTGSELWVLGRGGVPVDGARLQAGAPGWRPLLTEGAPAGGAGTTALWTGAELLLIGMELGPPDALVWRYGP